MALEEQGIDRGLSVPSCSNAAMRHLGMYSPIQLFGSESPSTRRNRYGQFKKLLSPDMVSDTPVAQKQQVFTTCVWMCRAYHLPVLLICVDVKPQLSSPGRNQPCASVRTMEMLAFPPLPFRHFELLDSNVSHIVCQRNVRHR